MPALAPSTLLLGRGDVLYLLYNVMSTVLQGRYDTHPARPHPPPHYHIFYGLSRARRRAAMDDYAEIDEEEPRAQLPAPLAPLLCAPPSPCPAPRPRPCSMLLSTIVLVSQRVSRQCTQSKMPRGFLIAMIRDSSRAVSQGELDDEARS